jgi:Spy/CpxP family protein refolding chaperone
MQEALRPFNEGVAYLMRHRRDLGLTADQVEDLLELRDHADRDVHEIEARMHSLADEISSQLHVGGLDGPDITDQLQQMGELQAKIDQRRLAALAKGLDLLTQEQRTAFDDILLRDIQ